MTPSTPFLGPKTCPGNQRQGACFSARAYRAFALCHQPSPDSEPKRPETHRLDFLSSAEHSDPGITAGYHLEAAEERINRF